MYTNIRICVMHRSIRKQLGSKRYRYTGPELLRDSSDMHNPHYTQLKCLEMIRCYTIRFVPTSLSAVDKDFHISLWW